jgi:hypothetical protein
MKAIFQALVKEFKAKSLVSGDKAYRLTLEMGEELDIKAIDKINRLHKADAVVSVALVDDNE